MAALMNICVGVNEVGQDEGVEHLPAEWHVDCVMSRQFRPASSQHQHISEATALLTFDSGTSLPYV